MKAIRQLRECEEGEVFEFTYPHHATMHDAELGGNTSCPVIKGIVVAHLKDGMVRCGMDWPGFNGSVLHDYHNVLEVKTNEKQISRNSDS